MRLYTYISRPSLQGKKRFERDFRMYIDIMYNDIISSNTTGIGLPRQPRHCCFFQAS